MHNVSARKFTLIAMWLIFPLVMFIISCSPESKPIEYGSDKCAYCRMSIVDSKFGCQIVTQKGKIYNFDAVECLVNYLDEEVEDESKLNLILTNTCDAPGVLTNATTCIYLRSETLPSPMGMYLNPYRDNKKAVNVSKQHPGDLMTWEDLRQFFHQLR